MTDEELAEQEALHQTLEEHVGLPEEHVLTGWVLSYEALGPDGSRFAGTYFGPAGMTSWLALGLVEWARRFCLCPHEDM